MSAALDLQNEESLQLKIIKTFMHGMMLFGICLKQCKALKAHSDWQLKLPIYPLLFTSEKLAPKYIVIIVEINKLNHLFVLYYVTVSVYSCLQKGCCKKGKSAGNNFET